MHKDSFSKNLYLYVLLSLLVPVLLLAALLMYDEYKYFKYYSEDVFIVHVQAQTNHVNEWANYKKEFLEKAKLLFEDSVEGDGLKIEEKLVVEYLDRYEAIDGELLNAYYSGADGTNYISGGRIPKVDGRTRPWYKGAIENGSYISLPYKDVLTQSEVITFSVAIENGNHEKVGVLGVDILLDGLMSLLQKNVATINGHMYLLDGYSPIGSEKVNAPMTAIDFFKKNTGTSQWYNNGKLYYIEPLEIRSYQALYEIDTKKFISSYFSNGNGTLIRFLGALLVLLFLATYSIHRTAQPIKALNSQLEKLLQDPNVVSNEIDNPDIRGIYNIFKKFNNHLLSHIQALENENEVLDEQKKAFGKTYSQLHQTVQKLESANSLLREKEELYSNIIENITDYIWTVDAQGRITYVSANLIEKLGYKNSDLLGASIHDLLKDLNEGEGNLFEIFKKRDFDGIELQLISKSRMDPIITTTRTVRLFENEKLFSIQGVSRDISDEKKSFIDYFYKNREMFVINEVNKAMTSSGSDLQDILKSITDKINNLMNIAFCTIRIKREENLLLSSVSGSVSSFIYEAESELMNSHLREALERGVILNLKSSEDMIFEEPLLKAALDQLGNIIFIPLVNQSNAYGVLTVGARRPLEEDKLNLLKYLSQSASIAIEKSVIYDQLRNNYLKTIEALANALEEKLYNMNGHTIRVSQYATLIARRMFLKESEVDDVQIAGLLHDIGKIGINDDYLKKQKQLSAVEQNDIDRIVECHPSIGKKILHPIGLSESILDGIYYHHQNFDLRGYPEHSMIDAQPLIAQIIQISDELDNLVQGTYSGYPMTFQEIIDVLDRESGKKFGPEVVESLKELIEDELETVKHISVEALCSK